MSERFCVFTFEEIGVIISALDYIQDEPHFRNVFPIASRLHTEAEHARTRMLREPMLPNDAALWTQTDLENYLRSK